MKKLQSTQPEKPYFLLRWSVILIALLLIWPIGVILLITKLIGVVRQNREIKILTTDEIPFAPWKTALDRQVYAQCMGKTKKLLVTSVLTTVIFLILGCSGITGDWLTLFANGFSTPLLLDFLSHSVFFLFGLGFVQSSYSILQERHRTRLLSIAIGERTQVTVQELTDATALPPSQIDKDLQKMLEQCWFGHGAYYDTAAQTLYCRQDG